MYINETLARGMTDRFFRDFPTEVAAAYQREIRSMSIKSIKRGKWLKATRQCMSRLERFSIASYEGGSKVKPYFVANVLEIEAGRPYNTWQERCLYSFQILFVFDPAYVDCLWGHFNISEHTIMRLFLRSPVQEDAKGNLLPYSIVKQLRYVPFWSAFWEGFQLIAHDVDFRKDMSTLIPAPDGLFIGQFSREQDGILEIRTFIDTQTMSRERKSVRDLMIDISEPLLESSLSASPVAVLAGIDASSLVLITVVCKKLLPHAEALTRCLFRGEEGGPSPGNTEELFLEQLIRCAATAEAFWNVFETTPLRQFLSQANHWIRQSRPGLMNGDSPV
jgi:hypothetical protein